VAVENVERQNEHKMQPGWRIHFLLHLHIYIFTHSSYRKEHRTTHYRIIQSLHKRMVGFGTLLKDKRVNMN
jgi:hypothetical protein